MTTNFFSAPLATGSISGTMSIPGSKSLTNREILLSAISSGKSVLKQPLISRDSQLMLDAIRELGSEVSVNSDFIEITPAALNRNATIHCGLAGTVMRFVPLMAALNKGEITFEADSEAKARPLNGVFDALDQLGVEYNKGAESFPFTVIGRGEVDATEVTLDASKSSQFVSALLLVAARFEGGLLITHQGESLPSIPHIEMTVKCLGDRGVTVERQSETSWQVSPGAIESKEIIIEPDLSNAGAFLAAAMVTGGELEISDWPRETTQVGKQYIDLLTQMGASFEFTSGGLKIKSSGEIHGINADLSEAGELTPTIAALAVLADSPSTLSGIAHLRGHETDRLAALSAEINRIGGNCQETLDGLVITPQKLTGGTWHTYHDHRMATTGAIIGLTAPIEIENIETTAKTMPEFKDMWVELVS
jgi:3-phosphoshikimate 1-carboxyvinyltransferase